MPRYVILRHAMPPHALRATHWDLMLETGDVLTTWALDEPPTAARSVRAQRLADHRLHYLDYEGPLTGQRGTVAKWDAGSYRLEDHTEHHWRITLTGRELEGVLTMQADPCEPHGWIARFSAG